MHSCVTRIGHFELFVQRGSLVIFQTNADQRAETVERIARKTFHPFLPSLWVHRDADLAVCYLRERRISVGLSVYLDMAYTGVWRLWKSSKTNGDHQAKPPPRIDPSGAGFCTEIGVLRRVRIFLQYLLESKRAWKTTREKKWRETIVSQLASHASKPVSASIAITKKNRQTQNVTVDLLMITSFECSRRSHTDYKRDVAPFNQVISRWRVCIQLS